MWPCFAFVFVVIVSVAVVVWHHYSSEASDRPTPKPVKRQQRANAPREQTRKTPQLPRQDRPVSRVLVTPVVPRSTPSREQAATLTVKTSMPTGIGAVPVRRAVVPTPPLVSPIPSAEPAASQRFPLRSAPQETHVGRVTSDPLACVLSLRFSSFDGIHGQQVQVRFLDIYYPKGKRVSNDTKQASRAVLSLKDLGPWGISYWRDRIDDLLAGLKGPVLVVPVPGSKAGDSTSVMRMERVFRGIRNVTFAHDVLDRFQDVPKSSGARSGGYSRPSMELHSRTISCTLADHQRNMPILLVDDVVTDGNTMMACQGLLRRAGASSVTCLSLTKTDNRIPWRSEAGESHSPAPTRLSSPFVEKAPEPKPPPKPARLLLQPTRGPDPVAPYFAPTNQLPKCKSIGATPYQGIQRMPHFAAQTHGGTVFPVHYFTKYIPWGHASDIDRYSNDIRAVKNGDAGAINLFALAISKAMAGTKCEPLVVVIPPSHPGVAKPSSPLRRMLAALKVVRDCSDCLLRATAIAPEETTEGFRVPMANEQLQSLQIQHADSIRGKHIVLLDLVVTSGATMASARQLLFEEARPASITCLVLGCVVPPDFRGK